jgi:hypothetical protein
MNSEDSEDIAACVLLSSLQLELHYDASEPVKQRTAYLVA